MTLGAVDLDRREAARAERTQATARWQADGARVDRLLPTFLTDNMWAMPHAGIGSRWVTLADLALAAEPDRPVHLVFDLVPTARGNADQVLPRGTALRMIGTYWDVGACQAVYAVCFDFAVEDGPMAGRTIAVDDGARHLWRVGAPRRTLAASMIVARGDASAIDGTAAISRYNSMVDALREGNTPTESVAGLPCDPITLGADHVALGYADPDAPLTDR